MIILSATDTTARAGPRQQQFYSSATDSLFVYTASILIFEFLISVIPPHRISGVRSIQRITPKDS
jgi:hypothetical protein